MNHPAGTVEEYLDSMKHSPRFGSRIVGCHTVEAKAAHHGQGSHQLSAILQEMLAGLSIDNLYSHQEKAIGLVLNRQHILVATPTASGKSLIYNLPVFHSLLTDHHSRALYIFPLKALAQDQLKTIRAMAERLPGEDIDPQRIAAIYDGDTSQYRRRKIRNQPPAIVITNPDMLHLSLLPGHENWASLFTHLKYIVLDEVHTYRGIFGSHMAWVIRRLQRICALYGSRPVYILSSATVGNAAQLGRQLLGEPVTVVDRSGSGRGKQHILLLNPLDSPPVTGSLLLQAAVHRRLRTIVYTQSRKVAELIAMWTERRLKDRSGLVASYRAGFRPEDRRRIERQLSRGELLGVIATSALELGIDIGDLDICILIGYPGSMMAFRQRAGRVGRAGNPSLVILIGGEDALDQYFMRHPEEFFHRGVEPAVLNPDNQIVRDQHLVCAAAEHPLQAAEPLLRDFDAKPVLHRLTINNRLLQSADGATWYSCRKRPQRQVNLRGTGSGYRIVTGNHKDLLGEIDGFRAMKDCHPGAIYLHMARSWIVRSLDTEIQEIVVAPVQASYHTRPIIEKTTSIRQIRTSLALGECTIHQGMLQVTEQITGYWKILVGSQKVIGRFPLDLPPHVFVTEGMWIEIPERLREQCMQRQLHFMGGIHAVEHALIGTLPLLALCDRNDVGGISTPWHEQVDGAAIFLYDGYPGGAGLTMAGFHRMREFLSLTERIVRECGCATGCPACVHSPKCGSGNRPIDKTAAAMILADLIHSSQDRGKSRPKRVHPVRSEEARWDEPCKPILPRRYGVFDLETRRSAAEVGGWHRAEKMGISVVVLYDGTADRYLSFGEHEIDRFIRHLFSLDLVVGFNNKRFDNRVLSAYTDRCLADLPTLDILDEITGQLGYRLSLDRLAEHTLGVKKNGNGLLALQWFREGNLKQLLRYCRQDVAITRDLFLFGLRNRHLLFQNKAGHVVRLPVDFAASIRRLQARARPFQGQSNFL